MAGEQKAGRSHNTKIANSSIQREEGFKDSGKTFKKSKFYSGINYEQIEVRE